MRKYVFAIIFFISIYIQAADLVGYRGTPLLNYRVQDNTLPDGEYILVRSYRSVTQILVSAENKLILYTDRNNERDSEIFVSSFSTMNDIILSEPSISQHEFNLKIAKIISDGDSGITSSIPFCGADKYMEELKKGLRPEKNEGEYYLFLKENGRVISLMTLNPLLKKLTMRNMKDRNMKPLNFYNIYIDECYDKNIRHIITGYSSLIKNSSDVK